MKPEDNYIAINRESWNNRTETHVNSAFYDVPAFLQGATSLNPIELALLGDIRGKRILHLQCHFGQDSLSLARMGAEVTGVDLSDKAIAKARELAKECGVKAEFICCDIYDLEQHLEGDFDFVFTTYGTIGWLPDMDRWAALIARYLRPSGRLIFVEFHPAVWMFDDDFTTIGYSYFNAAPIVETENGTYADKSAPITQGYVTWNHPMSEVVGSLLGAGLTLRDFQEYDYSPYDIFPEMSQLEPKQFRIAKFENRLPLVYSLVAEKK